MLGRLDVIALGLLSTRPRTGYDIRKWLDVFGRVFGYSAQTSQIYRQLARLVERGAAETTWDQRTNGPDAKLYKITEDGRQLFNEWLDSPYTPSQRPMDPDFQVRLHFSASLGPKGALALVQKELAYRRNQHSTPVPFDDSSVPSDASRDEYMWIHDLSLMIEQRGRALASTYIDWLEATEQRLRFLSSVDAYPSAQSGITSQGEK